MAEALTVDEFYEAAMNGGLLGLECDAGHVTVPPRNCCRICGSRSLKKAELSGHGKVISFTEVFVKSREFPIDAPYVLALVQLVEGGSLMGVVQSGTGKRVEFGFPVTVSFRKLNEKEWPRIFFVPE